MRFSRFVLIASLLVRQSLYAQPTLPTVGPPVASSHCKGPDGLEGWKLLYRLPDNLYDPHERLPLALVLSNKGRVLHRIDGDPIIWDWFFVDNQKVALETGPLHFGMTCELIDVQSGKVLESYDCYNETPSNPPDWVQTLEGGKAKCK